MAKRKGHGNGRGVPRIETLPADELPEASDPIAEALPRRRARTSPGMGLGQLLKAASRSPEYRRYWHAARNYRHYRLGELAALHGGTCGAAVGALVTASAIGQAAGRHWHEQAIVSNDVELAIKGQRFLDSARQNELAAWELAAREGETRRKRAQLDHAKDLAGALAAGSVPAAGEESLHKGTSAISADRPTDRKPDPVPPLAPPGGQKSGAPTTTPEASPEPPEEDPE